MYNIYHAYTNSTDMLFAALLGLPVVMQQLFALRHCFLIHLPCITQRENLVCIIQLVTRTPAGGALHSQTHGSVRHFQKIQKHAGNCKNHQTGLVHGHQGGPTGGRADWRDELHENLKVQQI